VSTRENVCVIGLGYIGLPTSVVLAQAGKQVIGVDVNPQAVASINSGKAHIVEPDLDGLLHSVVARGALRAQTEPQPADVFVIAVPTPFKGDHEPDLSYVESASRAIAPHVLAGNLVVLESTVPPGATEAVVAWIVEERPDLVDEGGNLTFRAAHCPERVLPGRILVELVENDRVVGGIDEESTKVARAFYQSFVRGVCVGTTARTAELAKLSENAFRDANIAFANELSMIAERLGVDIWELIALANRHPRVNILTPGAGVGGHCIAVDPWFIIDAAPEESTLVRQARMTNLRKTEWVIEKIVRAAEQMDSPVVAFFGLAYKPDVDDLRESPAVVVVQEVAKRLQRRVLVVEPHVDLLPKELTDHADLVAADAAVERAEMLIPLVAHRVFEQLRDDTQSKTVVDPAGVWS
jgi:UDP-N-acetyl-D-mannosaminuronic acid dehydrogenase